MLDVCTGPTPPSAAARAPAGTIPIVAWRRAGVTTWGAEGIAITAGTAVEWIRDGLGLVPDSAASEALAASVADTGGVVFVPALFGLGTPWWDYGARGGFFGMTRGTGRAEMVRAVLEGVAHRGADLLEAAESDTGLTIAELRLDGGMSANAVVVQALADFTGRPGGRVARHRGDDAGCGLPGRPGRRRVDRRRQRLRRYSVRSGSPSRRSTRERPGRSAAPIRGSGRGLRRLGSGAVGDQLLKVRGFGVPAQRTSVAEERRTGTATSGCRL